MNIAQILERIEEEVKKILFYAYKTSETFPCSCGLVSGLLARIIYQKGLLPEFDVYYIRGLHIKREDISDKCTFNRKTEEVPCHLCKNRLDCDGVVEHSWVEIVDKETKERIIIDFTNIQFDDEVLLFEEYLYDEEENIDMEELYDSIWTANSLYPFIAEADKEFKNYVPCYKQVKDGEEIDCTVQEYEEWTKEEAYASSL